MCEKDLNCYLTSDWFNCYSRPHWLKADINKERDEPVFRKKIFDFCSIFNLDDRSIN